MSPTTDNNDKPTTTEAVERTPDEVEKKKPTTWTGPRKRWVPIVVLLFVAVVAAGLTWLLTNIFQHKEEARNPFTKVVELDDSTYDPAVWGRVQRVCATTVSGGVLCGWMSSVVG